MGFLKRNKTDQFIVELTEKLAKIEKKLEFIERQNRRLFFSSSHHVSEGVALTWIDTAQRMFVLPGDLGISQHLLSKGFWEKTTNQALLKLLSKSSTFVDVGAHLGFHSITCGQIIEDGKVIAIEANPQLASLLCKSAKINGLMKDDRVEVINCAVSDQPSVVRFRINETDPATSEVVSTAEPHVVKLTKDHSEILVQAEPLDNLLKDVPKIDVIKIDVEGYEHQALAGAKKTIKQNPHISIFVEIFVENIKKHSTPQTFLTQLKELGLIHVYSITSNGSLNPLPFEKILDSTELRNLVFRTRPLNAS